VTSIHAPQLSVTLIVMVRVSESPSTWNQTGPIAVPVPIGPSTEENHSTVTGSPSGSEAVPSKDTEAPKPGGSASVSSAPVRYWSAVPCRGKSIEAVGTWLPSGPASDVLGAAGTTVVAGAVVVLSTAESPHDERSDTATASAARPRSGRVGMTADGTHGRRLPGHGRDPGVPPLACRDVWARITAWSVRKRVLVVVAILLAVALGWLGYSTMRVWMAWRGLDHFPFDLQGSRTALGVERADGLADDGLSTYLVLGLDERAAGDPTAQAEVFADAILLWIDRPGVDPVLVSIPRDLYLTSPCDGTGVKLDALFSGCGDAASGPESVALAVEQLSGIAVDHVVLVRFEGLVSAIDALGGIMLCTPHDLRNGRNEILPAGCSVADGTHALRYARARTTQALIGGEWVFEEGGDELRAKRQQDVLLSMVTRAKRLHTPGAFADVIDAVGDAVGVDERLSLGEAVGLAWHLRSLPLAAIHRVAIPTTSIVTDDGLYAVVPTRTFAEVLAGA